MTFQGSVLFYDLSETNTEPLLQIRQLQRTSIIPTHSKNRPYIGGPQHNFGQGFEGKATAKVFDRSPTG